MIIVSRKRIIEHKKIGSGFLANKLYRSVFSAEEMPLCEIVRKHAMVASIAMAIGGYAEGVCAYIDRLFSSATCLYMGAALTNSSYTSAIGDAYEDYMTVLAISGVVSVIAKIIFIVFLFRMYIKLSKACGAKMSWVKAILVNVLVTIVIWFLVAKFATVAGILSLLGAGFLVYTQFYLSGRSYIFMVRDSKKDTPAVQE